MRENDRVKEYVQETSVPAATESDKGVLRDRKLVPAFVGVLLVLTVKASASRIDKDDVQRTAVAIVITIKRIASK